MTGQKSEQDFENSSIVSEINTVTDFQHQDIQQEISKPSIGPVHEDFGNQTSFEIKNLDNDPQHKADTNFSLKESSNLCQFCKKSFSGNFERKHHERIQSN